LPRKVLHWHGVCISVDAVIEANVFELIYEPERRPPK
jgi:hypothetical protein